MGTLTKWDVLGLSPCPPRTPAHLCLIHLLALHPPKLPAAPSLRKSAGETAGKVSGCVFVQGWCHLSVGIASPWGAAREQEPWGKAAASGALPGNLLPAMASQEGSEPSYLMHEEPQDDLFIGGALRLHILFQLLGCKCSEIRVWSLGWWRSSVGPAFGAGASLETCSSYQGHVCSARQTGLDSRSFLAASPPLKLKKIYLWVKRLHRWVLF